MQRLASCATQVKRASLITFDCTQVHEALGITRHPSRTGKVDWLRSHSKPWSVWHPPPPESNGQGRLPSIAPKAMKRLESLTTRVEWASSMALGAIEGNRTRPLDSGGARSQVLHGLGQSKSPVRLGWRGIQGASWPWVRSKAIELARLTWVAQNGKRCMVWRSIYVRQSNSPVLFRW